MQPLVVLKSGTLYLVHDGETARWFDVEEPVGPSRPMPWPDGTDDRGVHGPQPLPTYVAHANVRTPWEPVPEAEWPERVRQVVRDWTPRDWSGRA